MALADGLIAEIDREAAGTERILGRVPADKLDWQPHAKSMALGDLAWHIANLPNVAINGLATGEVDVSKARPNPRPEKADFVAAFKASAAKLKDVLSKTPDNVLLNERFAFKNAAQELTSFPKAGFLRTVFMNHLVHHRGQLTVYLRLLDVPVPAMYGRSADENAFERR